MSNKNRNANRTVTRRRVLQASAGLVTASAVLGTASAKTDDTYSKTLHRTGLDPISAGAIEDAREEVFDEFIGDGGSLKNFQLANLDNQKENVNVTGYNLLVDEEGNVSEDILETIVTEDAEAGVQSIDPSQAKRETQQMAEESLARLERRKSRQQVSTASSSEDIGWDELSGVDDSDGDVSFWSKQPPYGNVKRIHELRKVPGEVSVYGVKAKARMNSARNLCNSGQSDYCQTGYNDRRNKRCEIVTDWGNGSNVNSEDLAPKNHIDDGTRVTFGGGITNDTIGVDYSISQSANTLADTSDTSTGRVSHKIELRPSTTASKTTIEYESYSVGESRGACDTRNGKTVVNITVNPAWDRHMSPSQAPPYWAPLVSSKGEEVVDSLGYWCGRPR